MVTDDAVNPYSAPAAAIEAPGGQPTYLPRLFSWRGRIDRLRYLGFSSLAFLLLVAMTLTMDVLLMDNTGRTWPQAVYMTCNVAGFAILPLLAHGIYARRRLHDLGQSGWFAVLACIPPVNLALAVYLAFAAGPPEPNEHGPAAKSGRLTLIWLLPISIALSLVGLIGIAFSEAAYYGYMQQKYEREHL